MKIAIVILLVFSTIFATQKGLVNTKIYDNSGKYIFEYKNSYALLIGVSDYKYWVDLPAIPQELNKIKKALTKNGFTVLPIVLNPDSDTLESSYVDFMKRYGKDANNRLLIYFSGHGYTKNDMGFLVPADSLKDDKEIMYASLSMDTIKAKAKKMQAKHALFLFDSCFSGAIFSTKGYNQPPAYIKKDIQNPIRYFITAGDENQETPARSVFASSFVEAISDAKADRNHDGYITGRELGVYLYEQVSELTKDGLKNSPLHGPINIPRLRKGDFVFFTPKSKIAKNHKSLMFWNYTKELNSCDGYKYFCTKYKSSKQSPYYDEAKRQMLKCKRSKPAPKSNLHTTPKVSDKSIYSGNRSYSKHTKNTVKDNLTGLIWQKSDDGQKRDYDSAKQYCSNLSIDGINNWRVPTYNELYYLADRSKYNPAINTDYFDVSTDDWYWTITKTKLTSAKAWIVDFKDGSDYYYYLSLKNYVRCVR